VKILRFLQESTIERLGRTKTITLNARIIAATNMNLEKAVKQGTFRDDLYYRLNVVPMRIPNLNERSEDILLLAQSFLQDETRNLQCEQTSFSPAAIAALTAHDWPGNIRELQNRIRRALGTMMDRVITPVDLGLEDIPLKQETQKLYSLKEARETAEKNAVRRALALSGNNISQAAKLLEISRPTLHDLLKKHRISIDK
jgi:two-component system NtrC family response regulator